MKIAVVGKGGAGKSTIAGTLARLLARRGWPVLALDSDLMPGLAISLGASGYRDAMLQDAVEQDARGRWRLKKGIGPVRAVRSYSAEAPDGVLLLQAGKVDALGVQPIIGSITGFYHVVHRLARAATFAGWAVVGDLPAGVRQLAFDWAPYAEGFVVLVEPTWKSVLIARRLAGLARARGRDVVPVANRVCGAREEERIERLLGEPLFAAVPEDAAIAEAERRGRAPLDHAPASPAVGAIGRLAVELERHYASPR